MCTCLSVESEKEGSSLHIINIQYLNLFMFARKTLTASCLTETLKVMPAATRSLIYTFNIFILSSSYMYLCLFGLMEKEMLCFERIRELIWIGI